MTEQRRGILFGVAAYGMWGVFPLYFPLLRPATPPEILAHRVFWSLVFCGLLLVVLRDLSWLRSLLADRRATAAVVGAAVLIAINWVVYISAVNSGQVVESSLGYFINPLVSVLLGVLVLGERLRRWQWVAAGIGALAVAVLTIDYGRPPWIALVLAVSFGAYGLLKKVANLPAVRGLTAETAVLALPAAAYLVFVEIDGTAALGHVSTATTLLLLSTGVITAVPLLCFGAAATRLPLTVLGLLQYLAPILQLAIGLLVFREPMPPARWAGFVLVWIALLVFSVDAVRRSRRQRTVTNLPLGEDSVV